MVASTPVRRITQRLHDLQARGEAALSPLPSGKALAEMPADARSGRLDELRVELYALSALLADGVVRRAVDDRASFPPYGLARSRFSELGMLNIHPDPYEDGSIGDYLTLWQAFVDTVVLHLHREVSTRHHADADAWTVNGVKELLGVFTADDPDKKARMRDPTSFLYGGLQFGTSVCVQLVEVGSRVLRRETPDLDAEQRRDVLLASTGPAYRLAVLDLDRALAVYKGLLSTREDTPEAGRDRPGWLDAARFTVDRPGGGPQRLNLVGPEDETTGSEDRLGCPARITVGGDDSPIGMLWRWSVEVAWQVGLLER